MTNSVNVASLGAAMVANSSGNVGIGVTPNNWLSVIDALQIGATMGFATNQSNAVMVNNAYFETSSYKYNTTNYATSYIQNAGTHQFLYAPSGTAGADISFTEAMRIDSAGRVGIKGTPQNSYAGWTNLFLNGNNQLSADGTSIQIQSNND
jgi:hypothetical protein